MTEHDSIQWFRSAAPYINAFREKTFVIELSGEIVDSDRFVNLIHDIALCHHLGIRLVIVHGSRSQIDYLLDEKQIESRFHNQIRISESRFMPVILQAINQVRTMIESRLSMGLPNTPMSGSEISVVSGNFVTGMPLGIINGVDMQASGKVRSINADAISRLLDEHIVIISNLGYSKSGKVFNLPAEELAAEVAIALKAEKLIYFNRDYLENPSTDQFSTADCEPRLQDETLSSRLRELLAHAIHAVKNNVDRAHIIDEHLDGGLLQEMFTRIGAGMMITNLFYEGLRNADIDDIGGIIELIRPLEQAGTLVKRSRQQLELEIEHFRVIERDRMIIACIACIPDPVSAKAEVACIAVHPDFRKHGLGEQLLKIAETEARQQGMSHLFILTTRTSHWFLERGFVENDVDFLSEKRKQRYDPERQSLIMTKALD